MIALMLMVCVTTWVFTNIAVKNDLQDKYEDAMHLREEFKKYFEVRDIISKNFIGRYDANDTIDGAIAGMVSYLNDPWSHYLTEAEYQTYLNSGDLTGIGISTRSDPANAGVIVNEVFPDSPASEAGLKPLDIIVAINDVPYSEMSGYFNAVDRMRGNDGDAVKLTLTNADKGDYTVTLTRRKVIVRVVTSTIFTAENIGYIRIRNFDHGADADFKTAVLNLQKAEVKGIVIDVRNNAGGQLESLCNALDLLLPAGPIITTTDKAGVSETKQSDANAIDLPLVVLTNGNSISAAEFFAAALQEYDKAVIVGEQTTGKGYAQKDFILTDQSALLLSVSEYRTPHGVSLFEAKGVTPDKEVAMDAALTNQLPNVPTEQDTQLLAAMAELKTLMGTTETPASPAPGTSPTVAPSPTATGTAPSSPSPTTTSTP